MRFPAGAVGATKADLEAHNGAREPSPSFSTHSGACTDSIRLGRFAASVRVPKTSSSGHRTSIGPFVCAAGLGGGTVLKTATLLGPDETWLSADDF